MAIIRPAAAHDLARIEEIYDAIHTAEEAGNVSIGWVRGVYPTRATAQAALDAGELFVLESDGTVYAAGRINSEQVPVYAEVPWAHDAAPEQVLVLHTLVVDPAAAGSTTSVCSTSTCSGAASCAHGTSAYTGTCSLLMRPAA